MAPEPPDLSPVPPPALSGLRVVEASLDRATRWSGRLLAGFGADVIRLEDPQATPDDLARRTALDAGKRSVLLPRDHPALRTALESADVVLLDDSWLASETLGRYGLDTPGTRVIARLSAFGDSGPYATWQADDFVLSALAGWTHQQGDPHGPPTWVGADHLSHLAGTHAAFGVVSALAHRQATGHGQHLSVLAHEVALASQLHNPSGYAALGRARHRQGNTLAANWLALPVSDGWIALTGVADWDEFWSVVLAGEPPTNPWTLADDEARVAATVELRARVASLTKREFFTLGQALKVICVEVLELDEVLTSPQMQARDWPTCDPALPDLLLPGPPVRLSAAGWQPTGLTPTHEDAR